MRKKCFPLWSHSDIRSTSLSLLASLWAGVEFSGLPQAFFSVARSVGPERIVRPGVLGVATLHFFFDILVNCFSRNPPDPGVTCKGRLAGDKR